MSSYCTIFERDVVLFYLTVCLIQAAVYEPALRAGMLRLPEAVCCGTLSHAARIDVTFLAVNVRKDIRLLIMLVLLLTHYKRLGITPPRW